MPSPLGGDPGTSVAGVAAAGSFESPLNMNLTSELVPRRVFINDECLFALRSSRKESAFRNVEVFLEVEGLSILGSSA